jgi:hypothetical protein
MMLEKLLDILNNEGISNAVELARRLDTNRQYGADDCLSFALCKLQQVKAASCSSKVALSNNFSKCTVNAAVRCDQ